jgi:hypothetical protein
MVEQQPKLDGGEPLSDHDERNSSSPGSSNEGSNAKNRDDSCNKNKRHIACLLCRRRKLRCDGARPKCSTCSRLNHRCEYTDVLRKAGPRRGYVRSLETRVTQLEAMLLQAKLDPMTGVALDNGIEAGSQFSSGNGAHPGLSSDIPGDAIQAGMRKGLEATSFAKTCAIDSARGIPAGELEGGITWDTESRLPFADNQQLAELNMDESMPPDELIAELMEVFFTGINRTFPILDRIRFLTLMSLAPPQRPKLFLQYAVYSTGASMSDKYKQLAPLFYKRACNYINRAETSSNIKDVANIQFVQALVLMGTYEYRYGMFPQAWLRVGATVRSCQMLNMHILDLETYNNDGITQSDSILTDEFRRTFWMAYVCDRTASSGTGWPAILNLEEVFTKVPLEDNLFLAGKPAPCITIEKLFENPEIIIKYKSSRFLIYILYSECQGELAKLIKAPIKHRDFSANSPWLKQFQRIDNMLSSLIFIVPPISSVPEDDRNMTVNLHLMVQTGILCLNKCALLAMQTCPELATQFNRQDLLKRCTSAASEITLMIRMSKDISTINCHPFNTFTIYTCARFFLTAVESGIPEYTRFKPHLDFLITTLRIMRTHMPMAQMFCDNIVTAAAQLYGRSATVPEYLGEMEHCFWPEPTIRVTDDAPREARNMGPKVFTDIREPNVMEAMMATPEGASTIHTMDVSLEDMINDVSSVSSRSGDTQGSYGFMANTPAMGLPVLDWTSMMTADSMFNEIMGNPVIVQQNTGDDLFN